MIPWVTRLSVANGMIDSAIFARLAAEGPLDIGPSLFTSTLPFPWGIWTPSNAWFLEPLRATTQTTSRSVHPFLPAPGLELWQTNRPRYSVCNNRPHLASAAMRPNRLICYVARWVAKGLPGLSLYIGLWQTGRRCYHYFFHYFWLSF